MGSSFTALAESDARDRPRLVLLIVVDQLRGDLVTRFGDHFGEDGFKLLESRGALFVNAHYSYGSSETAPGHATIGTGRLPRDHGIVANKWFVDDAEYSSPQAVFDAECHRVPGPATGAVAGASPHNVKGPGLADQIRVSDRRSRVYSVALKDRAAIFPAGLRPNGAFWLDGQTGEFISSTYYGDALPACVSAFNSKKPANRWSSKTWERALEESAYASCRPVDPGWHTYLGLGAGFPHRLPELNAGQSRAYFAALACSPFGNELVTDLAIDILNSEALGTSDATDMLCVGLSSNDYVGHYFGVDSPEAMDITVQTDRQLARIFKAVESQVGLDRCLIALTGDHGATTPPQVAQTAKLGGGVLDLPAVERTLESRLRHYVDNAAGKGKHPGRIVLGADVPWVYLNPVLLSGISGQERHELLREAAETLKKIDGVLNVVTEDELKGASPSPDDGARYLAWRCYYPGRAGQLYVQLAPYWFKTDDKIAGHDIGTNHDRHVPIFLAGPRVKPGRYFDAADPRDIAVTIAALLGIEPPLGATGRVLHEAIDTRP